MPLTAAGLRSVKAGPIKPLYEKWTFIRNASIERYSNSWLKNAVAEIPDVVFFSVYLFTGLGILAKSIRDDRNYNRHSNMPYKQFYTVMRPDDERVRRIQREYYARSEGVYESAK